jgi:membrane associated rhomboid family serine protease
MVTYALIALNILVFGWELFQDASQLDASFLRLAVVPANALQNPLALDTLLDFLRSMFFHGGVAHLLGNMLYLWLFGDNLEDRMGSPLYLTFYLFCGFVATLAHVMIAPASQVPLIGASGAIAGVLGGYLILYPAVKVRGIIPLGLWSRIAEWPAWAVLGLWFVIQLFNGVVGLGVNTANTGGVAFFAHVGGFVTGLALTGLFMLLVPQPPRDLRRQVLYERSQRRRS